MLQRKEPELKGPQQLHALDIGFGEDALVLLPVIAPHIAAVGEPVRARGEGGESEERGRKGNRFFHMDPKLTIYPKWRAPEWLGRMRQWFAKGKSDYGGRRSIVLGVA